VTVPPPEPDLPRCPSDAELVALLEGRLEGQAAANLHQHAGACSACGSLVAKLMGAGSEGAGSTPHPEDELASALLHSGPGAAAESVLARGGAVGRYLILALLGRGSMGEVYSAYDPELDRRVALKLLRTARSEGSRERLVREARALGKLSHPNVVQIHDVGERDGDVFLAMELVEGDTLGAWCRSTPRPPWRERLGAYLDAARGLAAAHEKGLVHRDVKPSNILRGKDGRVRVVDFGLAAVDAGEPRAAEPADGGPAPAAAALDHGLTRDGAVVGTPLYMAPEQHRGQRAGPASDQFSLCAALYEGLYGVTPFPARGQPAPGARMLDELLARKLAGPLPPPAGSEVPERVHAALVRGLSPDPADRFPSVLALVAALGADPVQARRARRRWLWAAALAAVAALALALAGYGRRAALQKPSLALLPWRAAPGTQARWLTPLIDELLAAELGSTPALRVVPAAASAAAAGTTGQAGDAALRERLSVAALASGSYALASGGEVTLEPSVLAASGRAEVPPERGDPARLPELCAQVAARVRSAIGASAPPADAPAPARVRAARLYAEGVLLSRRLSWARATEVLAQAAALSPDDPRIEVELASVLLEQRLTERAQKAASKAMAGAEALLPDEAGRARLLFLRSNRDNDGMVAQARALFAADRDDPDRALDLAQSLRIAFNFKEALEVVGGLLSRQLSPAQVAIAREIEAESATRVGEVKRALEAAERAREAAQQVGARALMGRAVYQAARATRMLGNAPRALELHAEAGKLLAEADDPFWLAANQNMEATIHMDRGELERARKGLEASIALSRRIGEEAGAAAPLYNLALLLNKLGDRRAAVEAVARATSIFLERKQTSNAVSALGQLGLLRFEMGDLSGAEASWQQALEMSREDKPGTLSTLRFLAHLRVVQGDLAGARTLLRQARVVDPGQDRTTTAEVNAAEIELTLAERRFADAAALAASTASLFKESGDTDSAAMNEARCALAQLRLGDLRAAHQADQRAKALMAHSSSDLRRVLPGIVAALLRATERPAQLEAALASLRELADLAARRGRMIDRWRARLWAAELEQRAHRPGSRARLLALARDARIEGFGLIASEAEADAGR
jgi:tetratricopeptide (TPR) repeat protein